MLNRLKEFWADPGGRKIIILFLGIILVLIASLFFQQDKMEQEMRMNMQFIEEKNMLRDDLDDLIDEHDGLLDEYGDLNGQLHEKDSLIQQQIAEIRNLIRTKSDLKEAKRKIKALQEISKKYIANIDSLLVVNQHLTIEKDSVVKVNKDINWRNYKLNKKNKQLAAKVNKGSVLEILDIGLETLRFRGTGKEVATRYAKKVQKVRLCFVLGANQIAEAEQKAVFFQLIDASGVIIEANEEQETLVGDSLVQYTGASNFKYENIEMDYCFEWERTQPLTSGAYTVNLIIEDRIAAQTTLKLR